MAANWIYADGIAKIWCNRHGNSEYPGIKVKLYSAVEMEPMIIQKYEDTVRYFAARLR